MAKILAVTNQKGGVGKTTSTITIASIYAHVLKKKVLIVDMDPQGNSSSGMGIYSNAITHTIYEVLIKTKGIKEAIYPTYLENLFIIPSDANLSGAESDLAKIPAGGQHRLAEILKEVDKDFDLILIDCPPSTGLLSVNALTAAEECIIPLQAELYSIQGVNNLRGTISLIQQYLNPRLQLKGVFFTMIDTRTKIHQANETQVRDFFNKDGSSKVFNTVIPKNIKLAETVNHGKSIITEAPGAPGAKAYLELVKEIDESEDTITKINNFMNKNIVKEEDNG